LFEFERLRSQSDKTVAVVHQSRELLVDARTPNPQRGLFTFVLT
jgi:hypothetical protein